MSQGAQSGGVATVKTVEIAMSGRTEGKTALG